MSWRRRKRTRIKPRLIGVCMCIKRCIKRYIRGTEVYNCAGFGKEGVEFDGLLSLARPTG
jgi:hypothetical protein